MPAKTRYRYSALWIIHLSVEQAENSAKLTMAHLPLGAAVGRLAIHGIEEIVTGTDEVLAQTLRRARRVAGLTSIELMRIAGISLAEIDHMETGRLGAFASPERARLVLLAFCDAVALDPSAALGRLEPYAARQLLLPPAPATDRSGGLRAVSVILIAGFIAWQAATLFADADGSVPAASELRAPN